jgi:hypothetical protein
VASWDDDGYYEASFGVHKCRRYHAKLRDFYQAAYNYTVASNAFAASGAFVAVLGSLPIMAGVLSGIVAIASLFESIFRYEHKARQHADLCTKFTKLAARIELMEPTPDHLAEIRAARFTLECEEPSEKRLVELMAAREEARSRGVPEAQLHRISWLQRRLGYVFTFGLGRLEREKAAREAARAAANVTP